MRPTRLGVFAAALTFLALLGAASTGNNLLYFLYGVSAGALLLSAAIGRWNLSGLEATVESPAQAHQGEAAAFDVRLRSGRRPAFAVEIAWGARRARFAWIPAAQERRGTFRAILPHRGWNRLEGLTLESTFPFGLIRHGRRLAAAPALALPPPAEGRVLMARGSSIARRAGPGEELHGARDYGPGDDARSVNWKLSARAGRLMVNEYAGSDRSRVVILVPAVGGEEGERLIREAAAACRFHIGAGRHVGLSTPEAVVEAAAGPAQLDRLLRSLAVLGPGAVERPVSPEPRARRDPEDGEALRALNAALGAVVFAALFLVDDVSPALLALLAPAAAAGAWFNREREKVGLPPTAWRALSLAVLFFIVLVDWRVSGVATANLHLMVYLLVHRALARPPASELPQCLLIYFLAFFLASGLTISLWYFPFFLAFSGLAAAWLMTASGCEPRASVRAWAAALAGGLALAAALFVVTPRVEGLRRLNPLLNAGVDKLQVKSASVIGFTENVALGFFGELKKSSARVMKVTPSGALGTTAPPPILIRGAAFDSFDGLRWRRTSSDFHYALGGKPRASVHGRAWAVRSGGEFRFPAAGGRPSPASYEFAIYPMNLSILFTVGRPWLIQGVEDSVFFDHTDSLRLAAPYLGGARYRIYPDVLGAAFAVDVAPGASLLTTPPDPRGRARALALEIAGGASGAEEKARAIEAHLKSRYDYSTFSNGRNTTLEDFLFKTRRGNCEYFASAAVVLLRHVGVPARLVTGFLAQDWNEYGRFYDVRQGSAHAWAEAYADGRWLSLDPTPPQGAVASTADAFGRHMERWFTAVQAQWYRHVIGFDQYVQSDTFRRIGGAISPEALRGWARRAARPLAPLAVLLGLLSLLPRARRAWMGRGAGFYERAERLLAKAGHPRPPHLTPREFAVELETKRLAAASAFRVIVEAHYLSRYADQPLEERRGTVQAMLRDLRSSLR